MLAILHRSGLRITEAISLHAKDLDPRSTPASRRRRSTSITFSRSGSSRRFGRGHGPRPPESGQRLAIDQLDWLTARGVPCFAREFA